MRSLQKRIEELETTCRPHKEDEELPSEILGMLQKIERDSQGIIVLSNEEQKANDQYVADLFAQMRAAGEIR